MLRPAFDRDRIRRIQLGWQRCRPDGRQCCNRIAHKAPISSEKKKKKDKDVEKVASTPKHSKDTRSYEVQAKDNFTTIAQRELGSATFWRASGSRRMAATRALESEVSRSLDKSS
jgi:hypothetical protein